MHEEMHSNYYARHRALPKKWSDLFKCIQDDIIIIMLVMLTYMKMTATNVSVIATYGISGYSGEWLLCIRGVV